MIPDVSSAQITLRGHGIDAQVFGDRLHVWAPAEGTATGSSAVLKSSLLDARQLSALLPKAEIRVIAASLEDVYIARMTELRP